MPKTIGYIRVSTLDQDPKKNRADILNFTNEKNMGKVTFVEEQVSGKISWRKRKVANILEELEKNDNLIVSELSRLGRTMLEIMEILSIAKNKEINIYALKGNWQLDSSIQSSIIAMAFSMAAEIERELISSRTKEALASRRKAGVILGRPKGPGKSKLDQYRPEIEALINNGSTQKFIANRYGVTEATMSSWIKKKVFSDKNSQSKDLILGQ